MFLTMEQHEFINRSNRVAIFVYFKQFQVYMEIPITRT